MKRQYVAVGGTPAGIRGPNGVYRTLTGRVIGSDVPCEHCDEYALVVNLKDFRAWKSAR